MISKPFLLAKPLIFRSHFSSISRHTPITSYLPTIYALSTHHGRAAIAVVRISGSQCENVYKILTRKNKPPVPRKVLYSTIYDPATFQPGVKDEKSILDHAVILYFRGPQSYTGEDVLELQLHGGNAILRAVLKALKTLGGTKSVKEEESISDKVVDLKLGLRYAEAGEFSRRAFENGALDLTQIEGIRDSIDADTELERVSALPSFSGATKAIYHSWRQQLVESVALLTALIDFSEDSGDVGESANVLFDEAKAKVERILANVREFQGRISRGALVKEGIKLDLLGEPNAGKSFLLNTIVEKEAAIVSDIPGTTRDVLEVGMEIGGYKVLVGDTAGLRKNSNFETEKESEISRSALKIEMEGIKRAKARFKKSDIILVVIPMDDIKFKNYCNAVSVDPNTEQIPEVSKDILNELEGLRDKKIVAVLNKEDLLQNQNAKEKIVNAYSKVLKIDPDNVVLTSCVSQSGIDALMTKISNECSALVQNSDGETGYADNTTPVVASERVETIISHDIVSSLERFLEIESDDDVVIAMEELKHAVDGIAKITGESVGVEEVLGVVFSKFCVGK